jgi:hypothetical protein
MTTNERIDFLTPVGRLVQGDCFKGQDKDAEGRPLVVKTGPNQGQPTVRYFVGLAIPKADPGWPELRAKIHRAAQEGFPQLFDAAGNCTHPQFAFKYLDGDSTIPDRRGNRPCDRPGFAGHWILRLSSGYAPQCYRKGGKELITDPSEIKRGYYVRVYGTVSGNGAVNQPGVFVNLGLVELIGYGEEIATGPDAAAVFGGAPVAALPPGASATPIAPPTSIAQPAAPGPHVATTLPNYNATPTPPAAELPAPAPDFLQGPKTYPFPDGRQYTREQLIAAGWTEAQIAGLG